MKTSAQTPTTPAAAMNAAEINREKYALEAIAMASRKCGEAVNATMCRLGERSKYTRADAALSLAWQLIGLASDTVKGMERFTPQNISDLLNRHINS